MDSPVVTITATCDRQAIANEQRTCTHVVLELEASGGGVERARPPMSAVFVVDVSGSMQGPPIEQVIRSVERLADLFEAGDRVGVVAFSHGATEVCAMAPMTHEGKRTLRQRVRRLTAAGGTNMEAGLRLAQPLFGERAPHERQIMLLLSDGEPNEGASSASALGAMAAAMRPAISVSSLGYGISHNDDLLASIAGAGGGQYYFIADPDMCQLEMARALGAAGDMVADGIELSLAPCAGVEIVRVLGNPKTRLGPHGLTLALPDMVDGAKRLVVVEIAIEASKVERLRAEVLRARLTYRRAGSSTVQTHELFHSVAASRSGGPADAVGHGKVLLARSEEARAEARVLADRGQFDGAAAVLRAMIADIQAAPGYTASDGSPLSEACELLVDEAMAMERRPSMEQYQAFRKGAQGTSLLSDGVAACMKPRGAYGRAMSDATAGKYPHAVLVQLNGPGAGARHALGAECTLGRTTSADIVITSASVSRRHTSVYALQGDFWVADLGSTNPTLVNGRPLSSRPHKLAPGDEIGLGGIVLRYEHDEP